MRLIFKTFELWVSGILFILLLILFLRFQYDFFIKGVYFEGFQVVAFTALFSMANFPFLLVHIFRKDYRSLRILGLLSLVIFLIGFLAFKVPIAVIPFLATYGVYYVVVEIKNKAVTNRKQTE